jgi:AAA+ ATPase superfamily predicted ATPase
LGLDNTRNIIIFGEVKWRDLSKKDARQVLNRLVEKSVNVKWGNSPVKKYLLIGKKVGGKKRLTEDGYLVMELVDLIEHRFSSSIYVP